MPEPIRFQDPDLGIYDFLDEVLVECPVCHRCARVVPTGEGPFSIFATRRLICSTCGCIREWSFSEVGPPEGQDPYFRQPLWLTVSCCGELLWAYNESHLDFIEQFVGATLREHCRHPTNGWSNQSLANRFPGWLKAAGHRDEVLKACVKLRAKLPPEL